MKKKSVASVKAVAALKGNREEFNAGISNRLGIMELPIPAPAAFHWVDETIKVTSIGHTFGPSPDNDFLLPGQLPKYIVQDFIIDQTGLSGCDGKMQEVKSFNLNSNNGCRITVQLRPTSKKIWVIPPGGTTVYFGINMGRKAIAPSSDFMTPHIPQLIFRDLAGISPEVDYQYFGISTETNDWLQFHIQGIVHSAFSFKGIRVKATFPSRDLSPGMQPYEPYSTGVPFNIPVAQSIPYIVFTYETLSCADPGPFVKIVS